MIKWRCRVYAARRRARHRGDHEELEGFYFEEKVPPNGRVGHLHRDRSEVEGHEIPLMSLPEDFPPATRAAVVVS